MNTFCERHGLIANTTTLPKRAGDRSTLGLRLGSTPMAIRGLGAAGFSEIAAAVAALVGRGPDGVFDATIAERMKALALALAHPIPFG